MEVHAAEVIIAIQVMQALAAAVLAALLWHFHRVSGQLFLRHWALSVFALTVYLLASAGALGAYRAGPELAAVRLGLSTLSLAAAYPHVMWLLIGSWEAAQQKSIRPSRERILIITGLLVGAGSALVAPFDPELGWVRNLLRIEARYLLTGSAFLIAAALLWRAQRRRQLLGAKIGAAGFALYGLQMLHVVALNFADRAGIGPPFYLSYTGLIDFLCQSIIGLGLVVWLLEIQQRRAHLARGRLEYARRHDTGTGLPNREQVIERLAELGLNRNHWRIAVISVGMNRYARLNRALGWRRTEQIMQQVAQRLREFVQPDCVIGRIADRDFVILRPTRLNDAQLGDWTERLLAELLQPMKVDGEELFITFCAGISIWPDDGSEADALLQHSQHALMQSTEIGRDVTMHHHLVDAETSSDESPLRFDTEIRRGLNEGQFRMHYQPIIRLADRHVTGFEALMRWNHPRLGVIAPDRFLDDAAGIGVLESLESLALDQALEQTAAWRRQGHTELHIAINVSARRFQKPELIDEIGEACKRFNVPPGCIELEITENTALRDLSAAADRIDALHGLGVRVALDDFGTGYSSLANLVRLPVDRVKLDREFLDNVPSDRRQAELAGAIISLSQRLGLEVVVEGIERSAQLEFLLASDCELGQGFLLRRPAPADQASRALESTA